VFECAIFRKSGVAVKFDTRSKTRLVGVVEYVYCTCISNANPLGLELVSELQGEVTPLVCLAKASEWQDLIVLAYFGSIAFHIL